MSENQISSIGNGLNGLSELKTLNLNDNIILSIGNGLNGLVKLEMLNLDNNVIFKIEGLDGLDAL